MGGNRVKLVWKEGASVGNEIGTREGGLEGVAVVWGCVRGNYRLWIVCRIPHVCIGQAGYSL